MSMKVDKNLFQKFTLILKVVSTMIELDKSVIGKTIKSIRIEKGISQEVCSGLAGIARSHLAMIENSSKQPNFETLWKLSFALGITPHELILKIENEHPELK